MAAGIYYPDEDEGENVDPNDRTESFSLINAGVALYGGFPSGGGTWEQRDHNIHKTVLSGDLYGDDNAGIEVKDLLDDPNRADNSYHVILGTYGEGIILDGFTISGGNANGSYPDNYGGGIYANNYVPCTIAINQCTICDNSAGSHGGGLYRCHGPITECMINNNSALYGGGLLYCNGTITGCAISGNSANISAGGIAECEGDLINCTISGNSTEENGGGMVGCNGVIMNCIISYNISNNVSGGLAHCDGLIFNCAIYGNSARNEAGGLYDCDGTITGCAIIGNQAGTLGGGMHDCDGIISSCILWENRPYNSVVYDAIPIYCCVQGGFSGVGCIDTDPEFNDPGYWDDNGTPVDEGDDFWVDGDYRLQGGSPCIDTGTFGYFILVDSPVWDMEGNSRVIGSQMDMGCYEYGSGLDTDGDWLPDSAEPTYLDNPDRDSDGIFDGAELLRGTNVDVNDGLGQIQVPTVMSTIQEALYLSRYGERIRVETGEYRERLFFEGRNVILTGTDPNDSQVITDTVIHGDIDFNPDTQNGTVITLTGSENESCRIQGLTITGGDLYGWGGGIVGNGSTVTIDSCKITGNKSSTRSGGLNGCYGLINNCDISYNSARDIGGGLLDCDGSIINCKIRYNSAELDTGGGLSGCGGLIKDCTIIYNSAGNEGGGLAGCHGTTINCFVSNNTAGGRGGGFSRCGIDSLIIGCTIKNNEAHYWGGGFYKCFGLISDCAILDNKAFSGGGLSNLYIDAEVSNCTIIGNLALGSSGGGVSNSDCTISNCILSDNSADKYGGGLHGCDGEIYGCTISGNLAESKGGGISYCDGIVTNCTIVGNRSISAGGIYGDMGSIQNCIIWDNFPDEIENTGSLSVIYSDVKGGWQGTGNIQTDPNFVNPGYWDANSTPGDESDDFWVEGDYHLKSESGRWDPNSESWVIDSVTSPCIDTGNPGTPLEEEPVSIHNVRINMGAYGGTSEASKTPAGWGLLADLTNDGIVNGEDFCWQAGDWLKIAEEQPGDLNRDGIIDIRDLWWLVGDWLDQASWYH